MKLAGEYRFDADVKDVWAALFDPAVLAAVMPGCEKLELVDGAYVGDIKIKVGPIQGKFTGRVQLEDVQEPERYKMIVDGRGTPGFVKADAVVRLEPDGDGTKIHYDADAQIGGKIASVGQRLLDASARAIVKQSLDGLNENIKLRAAAVRKAPEPEAPTPDAPPPPPPVVEYKKASVHDLGKAVTREVARSIPLPVVILVTAVISSFLTWLVMR